MKTKQLIPLQAVAKLVDRKPATLRAWVRKGEFPEPHCVVTERTWLYRLDLIEHFTETGLWPDGTKFRNQREQPAIKP